MNRFVRLLPDGDLRAYVYEDEGLVTSEIYSSMIQLFFKDGKRNIPSCGTVPAACGSYGVCTTNGDCSCSLPDLSPADSGDLKKGCLFAGHAEYDFCKRIEVNESVELVKFPGMTTLSAFQGFGSFKSSSLEDCRTSCLKNCSCMGLVYESGDCSLLTQVMTLWNATEVDGSTPDTFLKLATIERAAERPPQAAPRGTLTQRKSTRWSPRTTYYIVIAILLATAVVLVAAIVKFYRARIFTPSMRKRVKTIMPDVPDSPKYFEYRELCQMTNNFKTKVGQGGFSTVFQGVLSDGAKVAIKRLETARQGVKQFEAEVRTIGSIHHKNLVKLQGFGAEDSYFYLVYEFLENLSLDQWLFKRQAHALTWEERYNIALDIARGLDYLHRGCQQRVLHLDIKPQNILLDTKFGAKICDFGLARLLDKEKNNISYINTTMRGTPGYMAPEWLHARVTEKTDVYSFGIVLLEMVSGKKTVPIQTSTSVDGEAPLVRIKDFMQIETLLDDSLLQEEQLDMEQVKQFTGIALRCVENEPLKRPTMATVIQMLEAIRLTEID